MPGELRRQKTAIRRSDRDGVSALLGTCEFVGCFHYIVDETVKIFLCFIFYKKETKVPCWQENATPAISLTFY